MCHYVSAGNWVWIFWESSWAISLQPQSLLNWECMLLVRTSLWGSFNHGDSRIGHSFTKHWAHTACIKCWVVLSNRDPAMVLQCLGKIVGWCQGTMKHLNNERSEKSQPPATSIGQVTSSIRTSNECNNLVFSNHVFNFLYLIIPLELFKNDRKTCTAYSCGL